MTTASIKRGNPAGEQPAGFHGAKIKRTMRIAQPSEFPKLNPLAAIGLARYRDELTYLDHDRETSCLIDCCNVILDKAKEVLP